MLVVVALRDVEESSQRKTAKLSWVRQVLVNRSSIIATSQRFAVVRPRDKMLIDYMLRGGEIEK